MYDVLKYIHKNIDENLQAENVAKRFGYTKWYFCTKFHEYTGFSFLKYVRRFRLQSASFDILSGEKIVDVAMKHGYESVSGFNKAFLAEFGCYPSEFRKNSREAMDYYERKKNSMIQINDRCEFLRKDATEIGTFEDKYCFQRNVYFALGQHEAKALGLSNSERVAMGLSRILNSFTPVIKPREIIVGVNYPDLNYPLKEKTLPQNTEEHRGLMRKNGISDDDIEKYFTLEGNPIDRISFNYTDREYNASYEAAAMGGCIDSNHSVVGYDEVLKLGFSGILEKVFDAEKKNGASPFYESVKVVCNSACNIGKKYADEARRLKMLGGEYDPKDLDLIIETCERVPMYPARNFREAIQSLWFAHIINTWEDYVNANSLGRLDQILYPYYIKDINLGRITKEEAFELICCLWIKLYRSYDVQQSCVGGTSSDGVSEVNELSYMMLDATEQLDFIRCLSVRYSSKTEKEFMMRALEVVGHLQKGVPFFFNDDVMIPALEGKGISHEDASNYTQIGCVETVIPGKANPHAVTGKVNVLKAIEYILSNGDSMMYPGTFVGVKTGELDSFTTYDKFYSAILTQIRALADITCGSVKKHRDCSVVNSPRPFKSLLTEGCLESGRDFNDAGAKYDYYQIMICGLPNLADSLEVIRKFVYEEKKYTLAEIKQILKENYPDEAVSQEFINKAPKFGNDIESVDSIARDLLNKICDYLDEMSEKYTLTFHPQPFTYLWMIDYGKQCAATPDGRRSGEIIAYSVSPMQGRDFGGLTALLNSISKLPTKRTPGTTSAIVEIDTKLFTDKNIPILADCMFAAGKIGLSNVQFNTIDADTLRDAQKNPVKYPNLAVRVSGFSQRFSLISPELQNHIIERTKHASF